MWHNSFDNFYPVHFGDLAWLWNILHVQGSVQISQHIVLFTAYPLIPWIGVMAAGYAFGPVLKLEKAERRTWILGLGSFMTVGFFVLRAINRYGDPVPWSLQKDETFTVLSFLNTNKYPPSLAYVLMTIGPALLLLSAFEWNWGPPGKFLIVFGRVPMFFYLLHLPLILGLSLLTRYLDGTLDGPSSQHRLPDALQIPMKLPEVYLTWLVVISILFLPCLWYSGVKRRSKSAWLTYL
jgi:uncharacterized membrane protein